VPPRLRCAAYQQQAAQVHCEHHAVQPVVPHVARLDRRARPRPLSQRGGPAPWCVLLPQPAPAHVPVLTCTHPHLHLSSPPLVSSLLPHLPSPLLHLNAPCLQHNCRPLADDADARSSRLMSAALLSLPTLVARSRAAERLSRLLHRGVQGPLAAAEWYGRRGGGDESGASGARDATIEYVTVPNSGVVILARFRRSGSHWFNAALQHL
jgi:hypothetical protein